MAGNDRETTLIIKASDLSSQPVKQVTDAIAKLIEQQKAVVAASVEGTAKLNEFSKAGSDVSKATGAAASQLASIKQLVEWNEKWLALQAKAEAAATRRAQLDDKREDKSATKDELKELIKLDGQRAGSLLKIQEAADKFKDTKLDPLREQLQRIGVTLETATAATEELQAALIRAAEAQTVFNAADRDFVANQQRRRQGDAETLAATEKQKKALKELQEQQKAALAAEDAENAAFAARNRAAKEAEAARFGTPDKSGKLTGGSVDQSTQAATRKSREDDIRFAFAEAEAEAAAAKLAADEQVKAERAATDQIKSLRDRAHAEVLYRIKQRTDAEKVLDTARLAAEQEQLQREAALTAQRNMAAETAGRIPATAPVGQAQGPAQGFSTLSQGIAGVLDPAQAARETLDGVDRKVSELSNALAGGRKRTEDYARDLRELSLVLIELRKQANLVDVYRDQAAATLRAKLAFDEESASLAALNVRLRAATQEDKALQAEVKNVEAAVRKAAEAYNRENLLLTVNAAALKKIGVEAGDVQFAVDRIGFAAERGKVAFDGLVKASKSGNGKDEVFLGLRAYELQNLSYQINDVFTQLGSGTPITQVFAQQSGQIFQLFQLKLLDVLKSIREIPFALSGIGVAVPIVVFAIMSLIRALDEVAAKRQFLANLTLGADQFGGSVEGFNEAAKAIERVGFSYVESAKAAAEFQKVGFSTQQTRQLGVMAAQLAQATGKPISDAVKAIIEAFRGGEDEIRKFSSEWVRLTDAERKYIEEALKNGDFEGARAALFEAASGRIAKAAGEAQSAVGKEWINLVNELKEGEDGWNSFWDRAIALPVRGLANLIRSFKELKNEMPNGLDEFGRPIMPVTGPVPDGTQGQGNQRNIRNNNPANLEFRNQAGATMETGVAQPRFAKFENMETGIGAMLDQARRWQDQGFRTIQEMIEHATPPVSKGGENPDAVVKKYIEEVASALGLKPGDTVNFRDRDTAIKWVAAIAKHEGGVPQQSQIEKGVDSRLGPNLATGATGTDAQKSAGERFREGEDKIRRAQDDAFATEEQRYERFAKDLVESDKAVAERAAKVTKDAPPLSQDEIVEQQLRARLDLWRKYQADRVKRQEEADNLISDLRQKALDKDGTDLESHLAKITTEYDKQRRDIQGKLTRGEISSDTAQEARKLADTAEASQKAQAAVEVATKTVDAAETARGEQLKVLADRIKNGASVDEIGKRFAEIRAGAAAFQASIDKAFEFLKNVPQTPAVNALRERFTRLRDQAPNPPELRGLLDQAVGQRGESVRNAAEVNSNTAQAITSDLSSGTITFSRALQRGMDELAKLRPQLQKAIADAERDLAQLRTDPQVNALEISRIAKLQAEAKERLAKSGEDLGKIVTTGLQALQEALDRDLGNFDREKARVTKDFGTGVIDGVEFLKRMAELVAKHGPAIRSDAAKLRDAAHQVSTIPTGLVSPEARERAQADLSRADTADSTVSSASAEASTVAVDRLFRQLDSARKIITDTQREQVALQKIGRTTVEQTEAAMKAAYAEANKEAAKIIPIIQAQIKELEKLPGNTAKVAELKARLAEFGAETKYSSQFTKDLGKTIDDSLANRGMAALDSVTQSLGNFAAGIGSIKDVVSDVGRAFANFAAGVLKDIASMIVKAYLWKLIQTSLGISTAGGSTIGSSIAGAISHGGGVVGASDSASRVVDLSLFRAARRMHGGGMAGLSADEVPTILQKGEEVLSKTDSRNRMNAGAGGSAAGGGTSVRNVLAVGDKEIAGAMNGAHGEKVILNVLQRNAPTLKKWMG